LVRAGSERAAARLFYAAPQKEPRVFSMLVETVFAFAFVAAAVSAITLFGPAIPRIDGARLSRRRCRYDGGGV
jgi:hypothetical protein